MCPSNTDVFLAFSWGREGLYGRSFGLNSWILRQQFEQKCAQVVQFKSLELLLSERPDYTQLHVFCLLFFLFSALMLFVDAICRLCNFPSFALAPSFVLNGQRSV